jgi:hypothetical protein
MGMVKDGHIVFANDADRKRLTQSAIAVKGKKTK